MLSLFGSLPPGLLRLTVAQTSIARGYSPAIAVAFGAALAEFFQSWAAVLFTDWFVSHLEAERAFHWAALPVFRVLGIYLLFFAKAPSTPEALAPGTLRKQFIKGLAVSSFNLLAIPYWFVYCAWLRMEGWWHEGFYWTLIFALGVSIGTVFALSLYAWLGLVVLRSSKELARYANGLIGLIFLGLAFKILWDLI